MTTTGMQSAEKDRTRLAATRQTTMLRIWLGTIVLLVGAMIMLGGATRLTDSGLSITEWQPIVGIVPPLSEQDWQKAFEAYQQIPEYSVVNPGMSLDEFKIIFWWEWAHRFLGRLIGIVFIVPFAIFWFAGRIRPRLLPRLLALFGLGAVQGLLGWYMVKSGLVDRIDVSHYRLTAHLGVAVLIFGYALWLLFGLGTERSRETGGSLPSTAWVAGLIVLLIYLQILSGALVAGLDAGLGFNTWPLINGAFIPEGLGTLSPWYLNPLENPLTVQFDHRMLGYTVVLAVLAQAFWLGLGGRDPMLVTSGFILGCLVLLQATLGVWTLLLAVPVSLGLAHQAGAMLLFAAALYHLWLAKQAPALARAGQATARA